jgi:hypothetical protein
MRISEIQYNSDQESIKRSIEYAINKYKTSKIAIYRGSESYDSHDSVFLRDPTVMGTRVSAMGSNFYTLWIDNSARWKKFPPRSKSLICSTSPNTASTYGHVTAVIPLINTKIGVCPQEDFWFSFLNTLPGDDYDLSDLNELIDQEVKTQLGVSVDHKTLTYQKMVSLLGRLKADKIHPKSIFKPLIDRAGFSGMMDHILDPNANGFDLTTWQEFNVKGNREVWLSAPCAMLGLDQFRGLAAGKVNLDSLLGSWARPTIP